MATGFVVDIQAETGVGYSSGQSREIHEHIRTSGEGLVTEVRVAVIGLGGFAGSHHVWVDDLEKDGRCRLVATCDPALASFRDALGKRDVERRGVRCFTDYREMLDAMEGELDLVTVPTPITLHAEMHREIVARGIACFLEKPPTLDPDEFEYMVDNERAARVPTQVGFQNIADPTRRGLKERLVSGHFGSLRRVTFRGCWPRAASYYTRNQWAGRLMINGQLVLDSCFGNAMSHNVNDLLFWCGVDGLYEWAEPEAMETELYSAHAIPGADTVFSRGTTSTDVEFRIAATHACDGDPVLEEILHCSGATIRYVACTMRDRSAEWGAHITWADGRTERMVADADHVSRDGFRSYLEVVARGGGRPLVTLPDTRPFVVFNGLAYIAAGGITRVKRHDGEVTPADDRPGVAIEGIADVCRRMVEEGLLPSEQDVPWAKPGGTARRVDLPRLRSVVEGIAAS